MQNKLLAIFIITASTLYTSKCVGSASPVKPTQERRLSEQWPCFIPTAAVLKALNDDEDKRWIAQQQQKPPHPQNPCNQTLPKPHSGKKPVLNDKLAAFREKAEQQWRKKDAQRSCFSRCIRWFTKAN